MCWLSLIKQFKICPTKCVTYMFIKIVLRLGQQTMQSFYIKMQIITRFFFSWKSNSKCIPFSKAVNSSIMSELSKRSHCYCECVGTMSSFASSSPKPRIGRIHKSTKSKRQKIKWPCINYL